MKFLLAFFSGLLISSTVLAQEVAPDALVKTTTEEVLEIVRKDKDIQSGNTKKAIDLVRTYAKALTEYKNQTVHYKPFTLKAGETDVRVRTEIKQSGAGKNIELDYWLEKSPTGWKVYDIEVGGISIVTNYRESFAAEVRNNGIDGLIKSLQAKNKSGEAASVKK